MQKLIVYYSPTQANQVIVSKLRLLERLGQCEFIGLHQDQERRVEQLLKIEGKAAFLWGDGYQHCESYFFTRTGIRLKLNIDAHADCGSDGYVSARSHMAFTRDNQKIEIITPIKSTEERIRAVNRGLEFADGEVGVTVDCDVFPGFPAKKEWILSEGLLLVEAALLIWDLGLRISRVDIGGLVERIPEFDLIRVPIAGNLPSCAEANYFVNVGNECLGQIPHIRETLDRIGSYVVQIYAGLLEAFARVA
ncbi:MAG: hypothetical protein ABII22_06245 [Candidatus Micrarchaeota archaeon]